LEALARNHLELLAEQHALRVPVVHLLLALRLWGVAQYRVPLQQLVVQLRLHLLQVLLRVLLFVPRLHRQLLIHLLNLHQ
jgi:hypothetical protein